MVVPRGLAGSFPFLRPLLGEPKGVELPASVLLYVIVSAKLVSDSWFEVANLAAFWYLLTVLLPLSFSFWCGMVTDSSFTEVLLAPNARLARRYRSLLIAAPVQQYLLA